MNTVSLSLVVVSLLSCGFLATGCEADEAASKSKQRTIQYFNETVLKSSPSDAVQVLRAAGDSAWSPVQVALDYKDNVCFGAIVRYPKTGTFGELCNGINRRFAGFEVDAFVDDPDMRMWRNEEAGFAIQLSEDDDAFTVCYVGFVGVETIAESIRTLADEDPTLINSSKLGPFGIGQEREDEACSRSPDSGK